MKHFKIHIFIISVLVFTAGGCNDFLDVAPDERLSINNLEKIEATLVGSYQNARSFRFTHFSSDDVTLTKNVYSNHVIIEDLYSWNREFRNQNHQDAPNSYWLANYGAISQVNHALEAFENLPQEVKDKPEARVIKAEALIMRSYCHFMLVNLFSKHYDINTANEDLGVPYVYQPEKHLVTNYKRESVETVYANAEKDLQQGLDLMEAHKELVNKNKYRFTLPVIYNYASRFYNFRNKDAQDVEKAALYGEKSITAYGGTMQMRLWKDYFNDHNAPTDINQAEVGMVQMSNTWVGYEFVYQCTNEIRDQQFKNNPFDLQDTRFEIWNKRSGNVFVPAFYFVGEGERSAVDLFPLSEAVLNTAEAYIRQENYTKAKELLSVIGNNVYRAFKPEYLSTENLKNFYKATSDADAWTKYLLFERRNQFLFKGMRWFDLKRYHLNVKHTMEDGKVHWLTQIAPNKDYQIPISAINSGMQPNE